MRKVKVVSCRRQDGGVAADGALMPAATVMPKKRRLILFFPLRAPAISVWSRPLLASWADVGGAADGSAGAKRRCH